MTGKTQDKTKIYIAKIYLRNIQGKKYVIQDHRQIFKMLFDRNVPITLES